MENTREYSAWHKSAVEGDKRAEGIQSSRKWKSFSTRRHFLPLGRNWTGIFADAVVQLEQLRMSQLDNLSNVSADIYNSPLGVLDPGYTTTTPHTPLFTAPPLFCLSLILFIS